MSLNLKSYGIEIGTTWYHVLPFPCEKFKKKGPDVLDKVVAYTFDSVLSKRFVFPYRGVWNNNDKWSTSTTKVGLYVIKKNDKWIYRLRRPKTKEEAALYNIDNAKNAAIAVLNREYPTERFTNIIQSVGMDGKAFMPPVRTRDDALNSYIKTGIRLKHAPFGPYGKMLETYSTSTNPAEGANRKNNAKRSFFKNDTMSIIKAIMYCIIWGIDMAIILKDAPNVAYPMFDDGTQLIYYPTGNEFEIDVNKLKPASEYIQKAIEESAESSNDSFDEED